MARLRIGSRGSQLALWQANHVAGRLRERGHSVEIEIIKTTGDKILDVALSQVGTKGMFTKEIEDALADRRVDLAVHSLKDVPTALQADFQLAAILKRENALDVFVSKQFSSLFHLPLGARVGTSSLRRQAQLKAIRSDLQLHPLRGNVDTRLRKLDAGEYDAIILAAAGLHRLERGEWIRQTFSPEVMCPAAGQGALAIETRAGDEEVIRELQFLDDAEARVSVLCERAALNAMGGGCQVPIGAFADIDREELRLIAVVARPDGTEILRAQQKGPRQNPERLGESVAQELKEKGAQRILDVVYKSGVAVVPQQP